MPPRTPIEDSCEVPWEEVGFGRPHREQEYEYTRLRALSVGRERRHAGQVSNASDDNMINGKKAKGLL